MNQITHIVQLGSEGFYFLSLYLFSLKKILNKNIV